MDLNMAYDTLLNKNKGGLGMEKQVDFDRKVVDEVKVDSEDASLWKSVLQKAVRRGMTEKAMYAAYKLASLNWWNCWKRLSIIADEDVGQPEAITAVDVLYRKFMALKKDGKEKKLSWDMQRCVVCAAKILANSPKDRRSDEFLELIDAVEKRTDDEELRKKEEELERIPDEALDMHTLAGRRMGRGNLFWYEVSSETVNQAPQYKAWREWFKPLMVRLESQRKK
jgi:hypothetical protein